MNPRQDDINIHRTPLGPELRGYGERPLLARADGCGLHPRRAGRGRHPSVKHFAANNQEFERHRIDEAIDARTLHEIYFPAFRAAVQEADAWAVMSAYNKVNGQYCAENPFLLTETLKKRWGFKGFRDLRLGLDLQHGRDGQRGYGSRDARRRADAAVVQSTDAAARGPRRGWLTEEKVLARSRRAS